MQMSLALALLQVPIPRDGLSVAADIAIVVTSLAVVILTLVGAMFLIRLNGAVTEMRIGVRQNLGPVSDRARSISDNVEFITQALRTDVERLNASVKSLTDRLQLASERMEERIEEFNALMEVVQTEAEDLFLDTASTVRGVRAGARSIGSPKRHRSPPAGDSPVVEEPAGVDPDARAGAAEEA
ncbi:MAG: hypothetical protein OEO79_01480 [Gemmatimonadota bacterium]|nr:hypothetical protein [Gemmatimonadota bacterium]MDH3421560.1 hypothetical protein [Gemmatimonadota bacterium]